MQFEQLFDITRSLIASTHPDDRDIVWCDERKLLGLALSGCGHFEVFIRGEQLQPVSPLVRRHIRHDRWEGAEGQFVATQIALPDDPHYQPIAAFIAEELLRNGLQESVPLAFARSEPIIEMAIRRAALSDELIIGLIGELMTLNSMLVLVGSRESRLAVMESWFGYGESSRDFKFGSIGLEVKTTRSAQSRHTVSGVHQVDPLRDVSGQAAERLLLVSIGLEPADDQHGAVSLPAIIDETLRLLHRAEEPEASEAENIMVDRICQYGGGRNGYDHHSMQGWAIYRQAFKPRFWRAYDMADERIAVLRRRDLAEQTAVVDGSLRFEIQLPDEVHGELNPRTDREQFVREMLRSGFGI